MGINTSFGKLLCKARQEGVRFGDVCTIGHQGLAIPAELIREMANSVHPGTRDHPALPEGRFADDFIRQILGASSVQAIDYSAYQDADIIHDLNNPLPEEWRLHFDTLIDGGSLEHIFDIKQAVENYMHLLKPGGNLFILTTANNLCGHGFYQFSPEFFYRVFSKDNGFEIVDATLIESPLLSVEKSKHINCYHVKDPASVGKRIQLVNNKPTMIFVHAHKTTDLELFTTPPLQSDYKDEKWHRAQGSDNAVESSHETADEPFRYLSAWEETLRRFRQWRKSTRRNKRFFEKTTL